MVEKTNHFLSLKQVTIRDPFFSPVQNTVIHTMIPYQEKVLHDEIPDIRPSHVIRNYRIAAGEIEGTYYGRVFQDSDLAKWLEAVAYSLTVQPDAELEARADEIIDLIGRVQKPDGYLDTYFIVAEPEMRWKDLGDCHEMYCAGHMTEAAVAYYKRRPARQSFSISAAVSAIISTAVSAMKKERFPAFPVTKRSNWR